MQQGAMNDKKDQWDAKISDIKNMSTDDIKKSASDITRKVRDVSSETYDDAISYVRENPLTAALGLVAFGFVAGAMTSWMKKSA